MFKHNGNHIGTPSLETGAYIRLKDIVKTYKTGAGA